MHSRFNIIAVLVFHCTLLFGHCSLSFAQWGHSPDSNLLIGYGQAPRIISDENGGCFVNWFTGSRSKIQKVDKWGFTKWTPGGIYAGGTDTCAQDVGHMAYDGNGGVYVSFMDICCIDNCEMGYPTYTYHCMVQHIDSMGNKLWGIGMEPSTKPHYQCYSIALVPDDSGGVYVAFSMDSTEYGNNKIFLQRLDAQGNRLWGNEGIDLGQISFGPMISDGNGGIIYCTNYNYLHRRNKNSEILWSPGGVQTPQGCVDFVLDTINQSIYIRNGGGTLRVNRLSLIDASTLWGSSVIIDTLPSSSDIDDFFIDTYGNNWISWYIYNGPSFIQQINPYGNLRFSHPGIQPNNFPSTKRIFLLERSTDSTIYVAWNDWRSGVSNAYGQRLNNSGISLWPYDIHISSLSGDQVKTKDCRGGIILGIYQWSNFGIYVQQVSVNGNLGEVITTSVNEDDNIINPIIFRLIGNYPNPFNSSTTIKFINKKKQRLILTLYNILGQKIKILYDKLAEPDYHNVSLNMNGLPTGVYIYKLDNGITSQYRKLLYLK